MELAHHIRQPTIPSNAEARVQVDSDIFDGFGRRLASIDDLAPGVRISENIRLVSLLATGGMANVWIAALTADARITLKEQALAIGANDYLIKPVTMPELRIALGKFAMARRNREARLV